MAAPLGLWLVAAAWAADWPLAQGTEVDRPDQALALGGFLTVEGEAYVDAAPLTGLSDGLAASEGARATTNGTAPASLAVRRARGIARGSVPGTGQRLSWLMALEAGQNALTRVDPVVLTDASVTLSYLPGARLRLGQFKLPLSNEALQLRPLAADFIATSEATKLLFEDPVADGAYTGGGYGFRDVGAQLFDSGRWGRVWASYQVMVSNGHPGPGPIDGALDLTARVAGGWLLDPSATRTDPHRQEVSGWAWTQGGQRDQDGVTGPRRRSGAGAVVQTARWQLEGEVVWATGMLALGQNPPVPGAPVVVDVDGEAHAGVVGVSWREGPLQAGLRWTAAWRNTEDPAALRVAETWTPALRWWPGAKAHVDLNYEARQLTVPEGSADAAVFAASLGDRVAAEATVLF